MGQAVLVDAAIRDGGRLLRQLHESGGGFTSALWYQRLPGGAWQLLVEMPSVAATGPLAAYTHLDELLISARPPLSLHLADISVVPSIAAVIDDLPEQRPYLLGSPAAAGILTHGAFIYSLQELRTRRQASAHRAAPGGP